MKIEKILRSWRVTKAEPFGFHCWFDPSEEHLCLFDGPPPDGDVAPYGLHQLDEAVSIRYLDKVASVSASETEADLESDEEITARLLDETGLPF